MINKKIVFFVCIICITFQYSLSLSSKEKSIESIDWVMDDATWNGSGYKFDGTSVTEANIGNVFLKVYNISQNETYLDFSKSLANWLIANANKSGIWARWAKSQGGNVFYISGSESSSEYGGAPQIGNFFLNLYLKTNNQTFLNYSKKAANWLINTTVNISGLYMWNETTSSTAKYTSFLRGAANVGNFLTELYAITNNGIYLDYAQGAANWLINITTITNNYSYYEKISSPNTIYFSLEGGAAGIGNFFLNLYKKTTNDTFLNYAIGTANYLIKVSNGTINNCFWARKNDYGFYYTGFTRGTAGIAYYFVNLFETINSEIYLNYSKGALNWLISQNKDSSDDSFIWNRALGDLTQILNYKYGNAGIGLFFLNLYSKTNNESYLEYIQKTANKILETNILDGSYSSDFHTGVSGIINFLIKCDPDWDGIDTWDEVYMKMDPYSNDTDGDKLDDLWEYTHFGFNATNSDTDGDGLNDYDELMIYSTFANLTDSDSDGLSDYEEVNYWNSNHGIGSWNLDYDNDGLSCILDLDSDGDELNDSYEIEIGTNPALNDTDNDEIKDKAELLLGLYPNNEDSDNDGLTDGFELEIGTNPLNNDTDGDGLNDSIEYNYYKTDPKRPDSDSDGWNDYYEIFISGTDPLNPDTDGDGIKDSIDSEPLNKESQLSDYLQYFVLGFGSIIGVSVGSVGASLAKKRTRRKRQILKTFKK